MRAIYYNVGHDIKSLVNIINNILDAIECRCKIAEDTVFELKVVLNELVINAVCHGNKCMAQKSTTVAVKIIKNKYVYISVMDEGNGFDHGIQITPNYLQDRNDCFCEHGRGLIIVEQLCERVKFNRHGNRVSIIKNLS